MAVCETSFTLRLSHGDREIFRELGKHLQRSESDAVRYVVRETVLALRKQDKANQQAQPARGGGNRPRTGG